MLICLCCKGAACLGLGDCVHSFGKGDSLTLYYNSTVQMLTALSCKVHTFFLCNLVHGFKNHFGSIRTGIGPDPGTDDLACGASDHNDVSCFQFCLFCKFCDNRFGLYYELLLHFFLLVIEYRISR